jgi:hypothetical protein
MSGSDEAVKPENIKFATDDVVVYLAAAGAGKTSAIMDEMAGLLKTYRPDEIAFVTFTRKGAANGIERALQSNPQLAADDLVHFKTLHALCFRELGLKRGSIIKQSDMDEFNNAFGCRFYIKLRGSPRTKPKTINCFPATTPNGTGARRAFLYTAIMTRRGTKGW